MGVMSIRELNANASKAVALAVSGEVIEITRNGKPVVEVRARPKNRMDDPEFRRKWEAMMAMMRKGIPGLKGPFTYDERTER